MRNFIQAEIALFRKLSVDGRKMMVSIILSNVSEPLLWLFINTFLYRSTGHNIVFIAFYNLAVFFGLVFGYFLNGVAYKKFLPTRLYMFGALGEGLIVLIIIMVSPHTLSLVSTMGFLMGSMSGFYWANRNFLTLKIINNTERIYFSSLEVNTGTIINIIVPFLVGGFLVMGERLHWYSVDTAYKIMAVLGFILLYFVADTIKGIYPERQNPRYIFLNNVSRRWAKMRFFIFFGGIASGIFMFLPTLLVLRFVGVENVLGLVQSIAAIISAFAVHTFAKKADHSHRLRFIAISVGLLFLSSVFFGITFSAIGVLTFYILDSFGASLRWVGYSPLLFEGIHKDEKETPNHHYSYIFDQELFLNLGRLAGVIPFLITYIHYPDLAVRFGLLFVALTQFIFLFAGKKIEECI